MKELEDASQFDNDRVFALSMVRANITDAKAIEAARSDEREDTDEEGDDALLDQLAGDDTVSLNAQQEVDQDDQAGVTSVKGHARDESVSEVEDLINSS